MPRPQPVILLPPSEGKAPGGDGPGWAPRTSSDPGLDRHRRTVLRAARAWGSTPRRAPTRPAIERYTGVLYGELAWPTMPPAARRRGNEQLRIVSGLWGLVAPTDAIPEYRLKMSASLPELGKLSTWWRPRLAPVLGALTAGAVVWDLLPIEHAAAMDWASCGPQQRVSFRFIEDDGRTVNHWNKLLKGAVVRWLLTERPTGAGDITQFVHPLGYQYDASESSSLDDAVVRLVLRRRGASAHP